MTEEPSAKAVGFLDGAAVLAHSIAEAHAGSAYGAPALVAFVSPRISARTRRALASIGFESREKGLPIDPARIDDVVFAQSYANSETPCTGRWIALAASGTIVGFTMLWLQASRAARSLVAP